MGIEDMMNGDRIRRHRTPRINQPCTTVIRDVPGSIVPEHHILPPDLANIVRPIPAGLQIDDANPSSCRIGNAAPFHDIGAVMFFAIGCSLSA